MRRGRMSRDEHRARERERYHKRRKLSLSAHELRDGRPDVGGRDLLLERLVLVHGPDGRP